MSISKIPFGYCTTSNSMRDVYDVPKGKQCGCICASCKVPLIAVKGNSREWHFRHNVRAHSHVENECEYSHFVSMRLMIKQIVGDSLTFITPHYLALNNVVTQSKSITLNDIKKDARFENCTVDILGKVKDYDFILYITHPGRPLPNELRDPENRQCGILEIQLDDWGIHFLNATDETSRSHSESLAWLISSHVKSKKWIFHPRQGDVYKQAKDVQKNENKLHKAYFGQLKKSEVAIKRNEYKNMPFQKDGIPSHKCLNCGHNWYSLLVRCPKCWETEKILTPSK